ncbi:MAG: MerR family transcriptional regulator [Fibrobacteria bacterium]|nr:MerR family transcriptional regulator [Fibrobacteria bacterium]
MKKYASSGNVMLMTSGQAAKKLRISVSTLKRWIHEDSVLKNVKKNSKGWNLFSEKDIADIKEHQRLKKRLGRKFQASTLQPIA